MCVICGIILQSLIKGQQNGLPRSARFPALLTPLMDTPHPILHPVLSKRRKNLELSITAKIRCNFLSLYKPMFLSCEPDLHTCVIVSHPLTVCVCSCLLGGFYMVIHCKIKWYFSLPSSTNIGPLSPFFGH